MAVSKKIRVVFLLLLGFLLAWSFLTLWVQFTGREMTDRVGDKGAAKEALILFNPDPIYNLDEQVCRAFAEGLAENGFFVELATTALPFKATNDFDLYIYCANTYNWAPDWKITRHIKDNPALQGKPAVAITLGAGSTGRSQRLLEQALQQRGVRLLGSQSYWLLRPNDESRMEESNVEVATDMARHFGREMGKAFSN